MMKSSDNVTFVEHSALTSLDKVSDEIEEERFPRSLLRIVGTGTSGRYQDFEDIQVTIRSGGTPPLFTMFMPYSFDLRQHLIAGTVIYNP